MDKKDELRRRLHILLHTLWTKAVHSKGYDKREWNELARLIDDLAGQNPVQKNG